MSASFRTLLQLATICVQNMSSRKKSNSFVVDSDTALAAGQRVPMGTHKGFFLSPSISQVCHQPDAYRTLLVRNMHAWVGQVFVNQHIF